MIISWFAFLTSNKSFLMSGVMSKTSSEDLSFSAFEVAEYYKQDT